MRKIIFRGIECYVADSRIKQEDKIEGFNYYGIRHSDEDWGMPVTVEDFVVVNHWGTLATRIKLEEVESIELERWGEDNKRWCINLLSEEDGASEEDDESSLFLWAAGEDNGPEIDETEIAINIDEEE